MRKITFFHTGDEKSREIEKFLQEKRISFTTIFTDNIVPVLFLFSIVGCLIELKGDQIYQFFEFLN
ncbi:MAG: hypothetical protein NDI62_01285 [Burkholderiales bacterium]|nr:hypothetical protein [Burkholderiales bacterium]